MKKQQSASVPLNGTLIHMNPKKDVYIERVVHLSPNRKTERVNTVYIGRDPDHPGQAICRFTFGMPELRSR